MHAWQGPGRQEYLGGDAARSTGFTLACPSPIIPPSAPTHQKRLSYDKTTSKGIFQYFQ